jgi:hypothetical protein
MFRSKPKHLAEAVAAPAKDRQVFTKRNFKNWILKPLGVAVVAHVAIDHVLPNYLDTKQDA